MLQSVSQALIFRFLAYLYLNEPTTKRVVDKASIPLLFSKEIMKVIRFVNEIQVLVETLKYFNAIPYVMMAILENSSICCVFSLL